MPPAAPSASAASCRPLGSAPRAGGCPPAEPERPAPAARAAAPRRRRRLRALTNCLPLQGYSGAPLQLVSPSPVQARLSHEVSCDAPGAWWRDSCRPRPSALTQNRRAPNGGLGEAAPHPPAAAPADDVLLLGRPPLSRRRSSPHRSSCRPSSATLTDSGGGSPGGTGGCPAAGPTVTNSVPGSLQTASSQSPVGHEGPGFKSQPACAAAASCSGVTACFVQQARR